MENIQSLLEGFATALQPEYLIFGFIGVLVGTAVGVLPGIGPAMTVALLLPLTYTHRLGQDAGANAGSDESQRGLLMHDLLDDPDGARCRVEHFGHPVDIAGHEGARVRDHRNVENLPGSHFAALSQRVIDGEARHENLLEHHLGHPDRDALRAQPDRHLALA